MKKVDIHTIKESISNSTDQLFLYLGGHQFPQGYLDDAETIVKKIDPFVSCSWIWQDTEFDEPDASLGQESYREGALLIQINSIGEEISSLIDRFINVWSNEQKGILLTSPYSADDLNTHLKSLLWMQGENHEAERYSVNLQNPDFQSVWLKSFDSMQLTQFMGPIRTMLWLEINGHESQWLLETNKKTNLNPQKIGWYMFSNLQISEYEKHQQEFLHRELISHISYKYPEIEASTISKKAHDITKEAKEKGISDYKSILLMLQAQLLITQKDKSDATIDLLRNKDLPLDLRIQLSEQNINQFVQALSYVQ